jgi:hypothetical protein
MNTPQNDETTTVAACPPLSGVLDADRWRWLANDCDGNAQDDFIRWLSGHVASKEEIDAKIDEAMAAANAKVSSGDEKL